jgi:Lrp/AsnC family leucine-responsive transcriptional regulator
VRQLDSKDHKILYNLFLNSRQSLSSIGKKVGLPKNVVKYRIDRLIENEIILNFNSMIDVFKLGYSVYRLYFVMQFTSPEKEKEIIDFFVKSNNTWRVASLNGRYDLIVTILVKNHNNFFSFYEEILKKYRYFFKEIFFSQIYEMFGYKQSILFDESTSQEKAYEYRFSGEIVNMDPTDYKILHLLSKNSRIPSVEIAKYIDTTSATAINRMSKILKLGVIQKYSIEVDTNKLGYKSFIVNLSIRNYEKKNHIIKYLSNIPFINEIHKTIGGYDLELNLFTLNFEHFHKMMEDLRNKFPEDLTNYDYLFISKVHKTNFLPEPKK